MEGLWFLIFDHQLLLATCPYISFVNFLLPFFYILYFRWIVLQLNDSFDNYVCESPSYIWLFIFSRRVEPTVFELDLKFELVSW